jgi:hypothetical protein
MLWVRLIAVIAAVLGLVSIGFAFYGYRSLSFIQWFLSTAGVFENPTYANITTESWSTGFTNAMIVFFAFGILALVAAVGLFYGRRWGQYLWYALMVVLMLIAVPDLPQETVAWVWLSASAALFGLSWFALHNSHARTTTAP